MKNKIRIFVLLTTMTAVSWAQTSVNLQGTEWHANKKTIVDTSNDQDGLSTAKVPVNITIQFLNGGNAIYKENGSESTYSYGLSNTTFSLGSLSFTVLELSESIFTIQEPSGDITYFKRTEDDF